MTLNEQLKFSWGHIIAFVALIIISYFSFLGLTYLTDGNFIITGIGVVLIDIILIATFVGAQLLKATERHFARKIHFERALVIIAPVVLIGMMYPQCHFWTVFSNRDVVEDTFTSAVEGTKTMFSDYDTYADTRIDAYSTKVNAGKGTALHKENKILALKLQLKGDNYANLKEAATKWVDEAKGATVWNVFMIANIKTINNAITNWNDILIGFTQRALSEEGAVTPFDSDSASLNKITGDLNKISGIYKERAFPTWYAIALIILCYILLMFPYVIQQRNTKNTYHLFYNENRGSERSVKGSGRKAETDNDFGTFNIEETEVRKPEKKASESEDIHVIEKDEPVVKTSTKKADDNDDEYESFTM